MRHFCVCARCLGVSVQVWVSQVSGGGSSDARAQESSGRGVWLVEDQGERRICTPQGLSDAPASYSTLWSARVSRTSFAGLAHTCLGKAAAFGASVI